MGNVNWQQAKRHGLLVGLLTPHGERELEPGTGKYQSKRDS